MEGYVKNISTMWRHAMKRAIGPGEQIPLDKIFEQYGDKHGMKNDESFVNWLREVKLRDKSIWEIRYKEEPKQAVVVNKVDANVDSKAASSEKKDAGGVENLGKAVDYKSKALPFVKSDVTHMDITNMSVRQAREFLPKYTDQKILKYALNSASQLPGKETMCQMLRKRIMELELSRR